MLLLIAMLLLPGVLLHQQLYHDNVLTKSDPPFLKVVFVVMFAIGKINNHVLHGHIGLARVSKLQSHDIWSAPRK